MDFPDEVEKRPRSKIFIDLSAAIGWTSELRRLRLMYKGRC